MADEYSAEVRKAAKHAKVEPYELEICEWCQELAPARHPGCERCPHLTIRGAFSPSRSPKAHRSLPPNSFTWRKKYDGSFIVRLQPEAVHDFDNYEWWIWEVRKLVVDATSAGHGPLLAHATKDDLTGYHPSFDVHVWEKELVFGTKPKRVRPDLVRFSLELHAKQRAQRVRLYERVRARVIASMRRASSL